MADGLQDVGAVMTAGLVAREVERHRGGGGHAGHPGACANCGTTLIGDFCHACGQNGHVHKTAAAFFHDVAHGVFHFEGKVWHTLPMVVFRPGRLTRRYIDGERVRFVSPMALFLFSVFLMFASIGLITPKMDLRAMGRNMGTISKELVAERAEKRTAIFKLESRQTQAKAKGDDPAEVAERRQRIADAKVEERNMAAAIAAMGAPEKLRGADVMHVDIGAPKLDAAVNHALENPDLAIYKLKSAAYKYSWALIPISLPFIWLMFPFSRRFGFYDHAIFATYSLSFMMLLIVTASVGIWAGVATGLMALLWFAPPVHIYAQLKGTYLLGRWGALWRTATMVVFSTVTLILFGLLLGYLGLA